MWVRELVFDAEIEMTKMYSEMSEVWVFKMRVIVYIHDSFNVSNNKIILSMYKNDARYIMLYDHIFVIAMRITKENIDF